MSILAYVVTKISVSLFAGGLLLHELLGWDFYTSAIVMMALTGIYTIVGGMRAVVYTSVIQAFFLIGGALVLTLFGLKEVGGLSGLQARLPGDFFTVFRPADDPDFPWTGIVFGAPILAIWVLVHRPIYRSAHALRQRRLRRPQRRHSDRFS